MKKSFAVIGLGRFGLNLVAELSKHNVDIIATDVEEENVKAASEIVNNAFVCDNTNENALREIGVANVDHAIVAFGSNMHATILTTIILKEMGIKRITVRVDDEYYTSVIKKLGADEIVSPQKIAGKRLANKVISDTFLDYFNISSDFSIVELYIGDEVKPLSIHEIDPRNKFEVNLLLIQRGKTIFSPKGTDEIMPKDHLYIFGTAAKISRFDHFINGEKK